MGQTTNVRKAGPKVLLGSIGRFFRRALAARGAPIMSFHCKARGYIPTIDHRPSGNVPQSKVDMPTIAAPTAAGPTIADHLPMLGSVRRIQAAGQYDAIVDYNAGQQRTRSQIRAEPICTPSKAINAAAAANAFVEWAGKHNLVGRDWTVDEIWFLAREDFAPANDLVLPPRRVFLGGLQRQSGVAVAYDRRVRDRAGRIVRKTTMYTLPAATAFTDENITTRAAA